MRHAFRSYATRCWATGIYVQLATCTTHAACQPPATSNIANTYNLQLSDLSRQIDAQLWHVKRHSFQLSTFDAFNFQLMSEHFDKHWRQRANCSRPNTLSKNKTFSYFQLAVNRKQHPLNPWCLYISTFYPLREIVCTSLPRLYSLSSTPLKRKHELICEACKFTSQHESGNAMDAYNT